MKRQGKYKFAAVLALLIGTMSAVAGSLVIVGINKPNYQVLDWLVVYNILVGIISIGSAVLIWKKYWRAFATVIIIALAHLTVLALLLTLFREAAAEESIKAMIFRVAIWILIISLTLEPKNQLKSKIP